MAAINWQQQAFSPIKFDPTRGLAIASDAFGNIGKQIASENEAAANAAYRGQVLEQANRKQLFAEAAPQRAEDLRKATLARSAEQGLFADTTARESGGSHMKSLLSDLQSNPEYMALSGPERADFAHDALNKNKRLMSDPTAYGNEVRTKLLESGKFSREEANTIAAEKTTQLFPTMDKDVALKLFDKGTGGSDGVGTKARKGKLLSQQLSAKDTQDMIDNFTTVNQISRTGTTFQLPEFLGGGRLADPGQVDITKNDIAKYVANMGKSTDGIPGVTPQFALQYLQTQMDSGGTTDLRIDRLTDTQLKDFQTGAKNMQAAYERTTGGSAGTSTAAVERRNFNQGILSKLGQDQSTRQKRLETALSGLPGGTTATISDITSGNTIDVDGAGTPPVTEQVAPTGGILPPTAADPNQPQSMINMGETAVPETTATNIFGSVNTARKDVGERIGSFIANTERKLGKRSASNLKKVVESISKNRSAKGLTRNELERALTADISSADRTIIARLLANYENK